MQRLVDAEGSVETGNIILTIIRTKQRFVIRDMSQDLTKEIFWRNRRLALDQEAAEQRQGYDSIWSQVRKRATALRQHYDSVVFFTEVDNRLLLYVVKGEWIHPYPSEGAQYDSGNYKLGVVTGENKVIDTG